VTEACKQSFLENQATCEVVFAYHERTKHHFNRYSRSLGAMDWANQPNPFRYYEGALQTKLDVHRQPRPLPYDRLYEKDALPAQPLNLESLADFFRYSVALSAWKQYGSSRWALRVNPSSGNLHPTEAYALLPPLAGASDAPTLCHYVSELHALERRASLSEEVWQHLRNLLPNGSFLLGLSSILWREAWKYGERAFRYCQHDIGHALAALGFSAVLCGWDLQLVQGWSTVDIAMLLGLDRSNEFFDAEREEAELLCIVGPGLAAQDELVFVPSAKEIRHQIRDAAWHGRANRLSEEHVPWLVIDEVANATAKRKDARFTDPRNNVQSPIAHAARNVDARTIISQRRSCLGLDRRSTLSLTAFLRMLWRTLPGPQAPWDAVCWRPCIHLVVFVHRVIGLPSGVYAFVRDHTKLDILKRAMRSDFVWQAPAGVASGCPLYLLHEADCRDAARTLSCHQDIAADGFFSLGMLAEFAEPIRRHGTWFYRNLFWEAGVIGQVLYLEAEAASARATGIGCFFDDAVHDVLGLTDNQFQSLYHFTVGIPVEDHRLQSWPAYPEASK
jgi:SagB-type dehydrogenase family enzyme